MYLYKLYYTYYVLSIVMWDTTRSISFWTSRDYFVQPSKHKKSFPNFTEQI